MFPKTSCPNCNGPITFFEVMSIVTPFQSIDCSTCGEMVFLKHKIELFLICIGLGITTFLFSFLILLRGILPPMATYTAGFIILLGAEFIITTRIIRTKDLVVRRNKNS